MSSNTNTKKIKFININKSKKRNSTSSTKSQSYTTYLTHNNYLRPYMIKVYNTIKKIQIYKKSINN
jgi:hypothetical protein